MCAALGYEVVNLHRTSFSGISLKGLSEGNWKELTEKEMKVIQDAVAATEITSARHSKADNDDLYEDNID